jgi:isoquinoline 1-oxidoreductase alpha subunit
MADLELDLNGKKVRVGAAPDKPLLWVLREDLGLLGAKFGCGKGLCGACTVLMDGRPVRSCSVPLAQADGKAIRTIEGLSTDGSHRVQRAWQALDVPQCGYCQAGQIMAAVALLETTPAPTDQDIDQAMTNICRCGTYPRIRAAIHRAALGAGDGA